jgi:Fic family protein
MITLYLVNEGILEKPLLYLSEYFENNKELYYNNLTRVRTHNNMLQWIKYFLVGIEKTASNAVDTLSKVIQLKNDLESQINSGFGRRSNSALTLLNILFQNPVSTIDNAAKKCSLSYKAANDLVRIMQEKQMVEEMTGQSRNRIFIFKPYLDIFDD